jgi:O-acetyl-ADP-ribose deacetylase (regulator of RNase III)
MQLEIVRGDITDERVDAIVNAANSSLLGGGGVDGAIHRRAGPTLLAECRALRATTLPDGLPVGQAVATGAGALTARWVIHTVGPIHGRGDRSRLVACYRNSLAVAADQGARSVAFRLAARRCRARRGRHHPGDTGRHSGAARSLRRHGVRTRRRGVGLACSSGGPGVR